MTTIQETIIKTELLNDILSKLWNIRTTNPESDIELNESLFEGLDAAIEIIQKMKDTEFLKIMAE